MLVGHVDQLTPAVVSGWAADTDAPDSVVSVVVYADDRRVAIVPCDRERPDLQVRKDLAGHTRHGFRLECVPPLDFDSVHQIVVRFARSGELLTDGKKPGRRKGRLAPILVTAPGRSGTTLLMSRLSQSPKVSLVELPPFETRLLAYWSSVYRTLTAYADFERSTHPDHPEGDDFNIGSNPYSHVTYDDAFSIRNLALEYFGHFVPDAAAAFIRSMIDEYYERLRYDQAKFDAIYFAEKANNMHRTSRMISRILYPELKEIIIIRDPRDVFCSHLAYFRQSQEDAFKDVSNACRELTHLRNSASQQDYFVKYENMILSESGTFNSLAEFLCIPDLAPGDAGKSTSIFNVHATSKSPRDSIGRWKTLPPDQIRNCNAAWADFLDQFGYER